MDNRKPVPKLYIVNIMITSLDGQSNLFMFVCIATGDQEAFNRGVEVIRTTLPELYKIGVQGRGFELAAVQSLSYPQIHELFKVAIEPPKREIKIQFVPEATKIQNEKDLLIKQIIETRDTALLNANRDNLTEYELAYIQDTIK